MEHRKQSNLKLGPVKQGYPYEAMRIDYEDHLGIAWYCMNGYPRPCFSPQLLDETLSWLDDLRHAPELKHIRYLVVTSDTPGAFNLGGDLKLFCSLIRARDRQALMDYATACIQAVYQFHTGLDRDITTISLVQGDALGGGFETAISGNVLIAEKSARMGMPDILFNLFPGMGALSFLSRKVGMVQAEKMILSGRVYTAEEMFELGVVNILVENGAGKQAAYDYIRRENKSRNGFSAVRRAQRCCNPVNYDELASVTAIWVDAALKLGVKDIRMMERLVKRQDAKLV